MNSSISGGWPASTTADWITTWAAEQVPQAKLNAQREAGVKGAHARWHQNEPDPSCPECQTETAATRTADADPIGLPGAEEEGEEEPEPEDLPSRLPLREGEEEETDPSSGPVSARHLEKRLRAAIWQTLDEATTLQDRHAALFFGLEAADQIAQRHHGRTRSKNLGGFLRGAVGEVAVAALWDDPDEVTDRTAARFGRRVLTHHGRAVPVTAGPVSQGHST